MRLPLLLCVALVLGGCGMFQADNTEPPAELTRIETRLDVDQRWSRGVSAGSADDFLYLRPALHEGVLYVADAKGRVGAHDATTGKPVWSVTLRTPLTGGVTVDDEVVVVGSGRGEVIGLRRDNGAELWRQRVSSEVLALSDIDLGFVVARTNDGRLHALAAGSGELVWQAGRSTPALSLRGGGRPLMAFGAVIAGFDNGKLAAFSLERGSTLWETTVAVPQGQSELDRMVDIDGDMSLVDETLYAASYQGRVVAVNLRDGRILWSRDLSSYAGLSADRRHVYVSDEVGAVWALDRDSGAPMWRQEQLRLRAVTAPASIGEVVVVGDYEGYLHFMRQSDGEFVARTRVDRRGVRVPPLVEGDTLYVYGLGGKLNALVPAGSVQ
ncbi:MAG TPA: outer membrane protein assembly factor BamB [Thioalkalivibrio sp.]|nr:outer membrane protein assembly factor BamB [Thioalkalivibrio sp.]